MDFGMSTDSKEAVVYFVEDGDFIKIGWCMKYNYKYGQNMAELQRGNPRKLKYIAILNFASKDGARKKERSLHDQFKHLKHRGEWFLKKEELLREIRLLKRESGKGF